MALHSNCFILFSGSLNRERWQLEGIYVKICWM